MRGLALLLAALLAPCAASPEEFVAYLKVTPAAQPFFQAVLRCTGAPTCQGTYEATITRAGCSRAFVVADGATITGMTVSSSGALSPAGGRISFAGLDFTETHLADGSCAFGAFRDLAGSYTKGTFGISAALVDASGRTVAVSQYLPYIEPSFAEPAVDLAAVKTRIDGTSANATVRLTFPAADVGNVSNIYVFALAPRSVVGGVLAASKDATECVLAQLDPATNRLVGTSVPGLDPLLTGVLSSQGQSLAVLANVPTAQVAGATFFAGYGRDPETMVSQWTNRDAVSVPGTQSCPAQMPATPGPLTGLWWNPSEAGWGIHFTQRRDVVFGAWYGYDAAGSPKWLVASRCATPSAGMTRGTCSGTLYEVNGPTFFGVPFHPVTPAQVSATGSLQVDFSDADHATLSFTHAGVSRRVAIQREAFAPAVSSGTDYTDLWWNPDESGWGLALTHRSSVMFLAWYVYDGAGRPMWYVASNCAVDADGGGCSGTLYRTTGPPLGASFDTSRVQVFTAGTVSLTFLGPNAAMLDYTVGGVTDSKVITRELF